MAGKVLQDLTDQFQALSKGVCSGLYIRVEMILMGNRYELYRRGATEIRFAASGE